MSGPRIHPTPSKPDGISELDCPQEADGMARWIYSIWGEHDPEITFESCKQDLIDGLDEHTGIPKTFVYRKGGHVAGWASIIPSDLSSRPSMGPWLANLIVLPDFRGQGIAHALIQYAMKYARDFTDVLYLYTDNMQSTYALLGWTAIDEMFLPTGKPITIMRWEPVL